MRIGKKKKSTEFGRNWVCKALEKQEPKDCLEWAAPNGVLFLPHYPFSFLAKWEKAGRADEPKRPHPETVNIFWSIPHHLLTFLFRRAKHKRHAHTLWGAYPPPTCSASPWKASHPAFLKEDEDKTNGHHCKPSAPIIQSPPSRFPSSYKSQGNHVLDTRPTPLPQ